MTVYIKIQYKNQSSTARLSSKPLIIGRSRSCDVKINDQEISSKHLSISTDNLGRVIAKDLGSTNGTFLNSNKINETTLHLDDSIRLGNHTIISLDQSQMDEEEKELLRRNEKSKVTFIDIDAPDKQRKAVDEATRQLKAARQRNQGLQESPRKDNNISKKKGPR